MLHLSLWDLGHSRGLYLAVSSFLFKISAYRMGNFIVYFQEICPGPVILLQSMGPVTSPAPMGSSRDFHPSEVNHNGSNSVDMSRDLENSEKVIDTKYIRKLYGFSLYNE